MGSVNFVYFTDPHTTDHPPESRIDNYLDALIKKLTWVVAFANERDAYLICGGDWIHKFNSKPYIINLVLSVLRKANKPVFSVIGNHDIYGQNYTVFKDVIIGTLFSSGMVTLLGKEPVFVTDDLEGIRVQLTGANYVPNIDSNKDIYNVKKEDYVTCAIHVVHSFLVHKHWDTIEHSKYTLISEVMTGADVICSGHEHQGFGVIQQDGIIYTNPGALGRISSSLREVNRMPKVTLISVFNDHVEAKLIDVPARPGTEVLSREKIEEAIAQKKKLNEFRAGLMEERHLCDLLTIFSEQVKIQGVSDEIRQVSWDAVQEYEKKLAGGHDNVWTKANNT